MVVFSPPAAVGRVQFERPEEVGRLFEVLPARDDLMDQILHTDNPVLPWKEEISQRLTIG